MLNKQEKQEIREIVNSLDKIASKVGALCRTHRNDTNSVVYGVANAAFWGICKIADQLEKLAK